MVHVTMFCEMYKSSTILNKVHQGNTKAKK